MIKRSLIYSLVTLITPCMFFLFTEKVIGIVLLMECMYYIMAIVYVRIVSRFIQVTLDKGLYSAEKNSEIPILIQVKNKSKNRKERNVFWGFLLDIYPPRRYNKIGCEQPQRLPYYRRVCRGMRFAPCGVLR